MQKQQIEKELSTALLGWYVFPKDAQVLWIDSENASYDELFQFLSGKDIRIERCESTEVNELTRLYDYILLVGVIEKSKHPARLLEMLRKHLHKNGKLLVAANNRLGIRYFCGDKDPYTGHILDGIDNYGKVSPQRKEKICGRAYSKDELRKMLLDVGLSKQHFYSVMPSMERPQILISENYIPNESLAIRVFPQYYSPHTIFMEEEKLYDDLMRNGLFHSMANAYLIECTESGELSNVNQITVSNDRGHRDAMVTIIKKEECVCKRPLYAEGKEKVSNLIENTDYLQSHGIPMVRAEEKDGDFVMPYIDGRIATVYLQELLKNNTDEFIRALEEFQDIILRSSEHVSYDKVNWQHFDPEWEKRKADDPNLNKWRDLAHGNEEDRKNIGVILKRGYIDLVSLNCFYNEEGFIFFDQEFYLDNLPANVIFLRTIDLIYRDSMELENQLPREVVLKHFSLYEHRDIWRKYTSVFMRKLRSERELSSYHRRVRRDAREVAANRHRMDYTQEEYDRLFTNIFRDIDNKKIFLFGSGKFSEQFIKQFKDSYEIAGIVDNNREKWGTTLENIKITSPAILKEQQEPFKVFICIKFFEDVLEQLKHMEIREMAVYNPALEYERPLKQMAVLKNEEHKLYHVGYVAGVFDLFHIGHLNLLKRAKEQCDYLIVGVVSDEQVIRNKRTRPYIPFEERKEIVQSCKYVDEAVRIPEDHPGTEEAYRRYHFDAQFSGSDYENDPDWMAKREYLRQHGAELVFFPYTQSTSSTTLKEKIGH